MFLWWEGDMEDVRAMRVAMVKRILMIEVVVFRVWFWCLENMYLNE
jgi:hypothetical protein